MANLPLVYPASIGFSLEWVLAFTKSITWLVCRIAGLFYALWETTLLTLKFMEERKLCSQGIIGWENVNKSPSSKWKGTNCASPVTVHINQGSYLTAQSYLRFVDFEHSITFSSLGPWYICSIFQFLHSNSKCVHLGSKAIQPCRIGSHLHGRQISPCVR